MNTIDADAFDTDEERFGPQEITQVRAEDADGWVVILPNSSKLDVYSVSRLMHGVGEPSAMVALRGVTIEANGQQCNYQQSATVPADRLLTIDQNHECLA